MSNKKKLCAMAITDILRENTFYIENRKMSDYIGSLKGVDKGHGWDEVLLLTDEVKRSIVRDRMDLGLYVKEAEGIYKVGYRELRDRLHRLGYDRELVEKVMERYEEIVDEYYRRKKVVEGNKVKKVEEL